MKRGLSLVAVICMAAPVFAQDAGVQTSRVSMSGGPDLFAPLFMEDAVPLQTGQLDLRLAFEYVTTDRLADRYVLSPKIVWGAAEGLELSATVPVDVGESGNRADGSNGNGDTLLGGLWRFAEQEDYWPAMALSATLRAPTGDDSSGVDLELRLVMTNEYEGDLRSHINVYGKSANGDNSRRDARDLQYGIVAGMDGPLCMDGAVRWVADFVHRSSEFDGDSNASLLEFGAEWSIDDANKFGLSTHFAVDGRDSTPDFGAKINYVWSVLY